jgi:hypothetical protein
VTVCGRCSSFDRHAERVLVDRLYSDHGRGVPGHDALHGTTRARVDSPGTCGREAPWPQGGDVGRIPKFWAMHKQRELQHWLGFSEGSIGPLSNSSEEPGWPLRWLCTRRCKGP